MGRIGWVGVVAVVVGIGSGCAGDPIRCAVDEDCRQGGAPGFCLESPKSDERWCAFADARCAAGYRWGVLAGDGLDDACLPDEHPRYTLTVGHRGSGAGSVVSLPPGIDCGTSCTAQFPAGVTVTLAASEADPAKPFLGWSGACRGRATCSVTLDADQSVSALFAAPGEALWVKQLGGPDGDGVSAVATAANGDVIVAGGFGVRATLGDSTLESAGGEDAFVGRLSGTTGDVLWTFGFGGTGADTIQHLAVDVNGGVFVLGAFEGTARLGEHLVTSAGGNDLFVARLDGGTGQPMWVSRVGGPSSERANRLDLDARSGSPVLAGSFGGALTIGDETLTSAGETDVFVTKLDPDDGSHIWPLREGGVGRDTVTDVSCGDDGDVVISGFFIDRGENNYLAKISGAGGDVLFRQAYEAMGSAEPAGISVDRDGSIHLLGSFDGTLSLGGVTISAGAGSAIFRAKLSPAGAVLWGEAFGGTSALFGRRVVVGPDRNVMFAGEFFGAASFGGETFSSAGDSDIFVALHGPDPGTHLGSVRVGGSRFDQVADIAIGAAQEPIIVGTFQGFSEFGTTLLTSAGGMDGMVVMLAPF